MFDSNNLVFIMAGNEYIAEKYRSEGFRVYKPYRGNSLMARILREICFFLPVLSDRIWFDKRIVFDGSLKYIVIRDALITKNYLLWVKKKFPDAQINFSYSNMVGKATHVHPEEIPDGIRIWTFDEYDSQKYGIRHLKSRSYNDARIKPRKENKYDILYVGRDKGRGEYLLSLKAKFESMGLTVKFIIVADGRFAKRKKYYDKLISYDEITELLAESRAVLNVTMPNQKGITLRDIEALFNDIKLITTNQYIVENEIFDENNVFVLQENNFDDICTFLDKPVNVRNDLKEKYSLNTVLKEMVGME